MNRNRERQAVLAISVTGFFAFVGGGAVQIYLGPYLKETLKILPLKASLILATVYTFMALGRFFTPLVIGRLGAVAALAVGAVTYAIFPLVFSLTRSYPILILAAAVWGCGASLFWTSSMTELLNFSHVKRYAANQGIQRIFNEASQIVGLFLLGQTLILFGYPTLFRLAACLSIVAPVCVYFWVPTSTANHQAAKSHIVARQAINFKHWLVFLTLFVSGFSYGVILNVLNLMVSDLFGRAWMNKTLIFFYLFAGLFSYLGGAFSDRFGRRIGFLSAFTAGFLGVTILAFRPSLFNVALASIMLGVIFGMVPTVTAGLIGDRSEPKDRALNMAAFFFWRDAGVAISVFLGGALLQSSLSYRNVLLPFGLLFLIISSLFWRKTSFMKTYGG